MGKSQSQEIMLKTAFSYIEEVEKALEEFSGAVASESQNADSAFEAGFMRGIGTAFKGQWKVGKEKEKLMKNLHLAENVLKSIEQKTPDAQLEVEEDVFTIPAMKAIVHELRGRICVIAGELKRAEAYFKDSLNYFEEPGTYYWLALVLEETKEPRKACEMYQKCIDVATDMSQRIDGVAERTEKLIITARKDLQKLESAKIGNGWFVGSWKVFLILAGISIISLLGAVLDKNADTLSGAIIFGGIAGVYWWRKRR